MNATTLLFLLLVLACPLMMIFMMRGHGHGHGAQSEGAQGHGCHGGSDDGDSKESLDELRRRRAELDSLIEEREAVEADRAPVFAGKER